MFKTILAEQWNNLSPSVQKHYDSKNGETITMKGVLAVKHDKFIKLLMPLIRLTGALVPVEGEYFDVTVENKRIGNTFYWHRQFTKDNKTYEFKSKMQPYKNDIIEMVGLGIGIRLGLSVNRDHLIFEDKGYILKLGQDVIPIPLHYLVGKSFIEEYRDADSPNDLEMRFIINHPWFGFAFSYMGYFNFVPTNDMQGVNNE